MLEPNAREQLIRLITEKVLAALPANILPRPDASNQERSQSSTADTQVPVQSPADFITNPRATNAEANFVAKKLFTEADLVRLFQAGLTRIVIHSRAILTPLAQEFVRQKGITLERTEQPRLDSATSITTRLVSVIAPQCNRWQKSALFTSIRRAGWTENEIEVASTLVNAIEAATNELIQALQSKKVSAGLIITENAFALAMAANKFDGIRAVTCWDLASARSSRQASQANLLVLDPRLLAWYLIRRIIQTWLSTPIPNI